MPNFKIIPRENIVSLLDDIDAYCENERFDRSKFSRYIGSEKLIDDDEHSCFLGMFDGDKCLSMAYLNKVPEKFILIAQIQCVIHGFGKPLIEKIISLSRNLWLVADPDGGESLLDYYRQFGLKETTNGHGKTIFFKAENSRLAEMLKGHIERFTRSTTQRLKTPRQTPRTRSSGKSKPRRNTFRRFPD